MQKEESLPTSFTVAGRTYEFVPFFKKGEVWVKGETMLARAVELEAELGEEDARLILKYRDEIPAALCNCITTMIFPGWRTGGGKEFRYFATVIWFERRCLYWDLVKNWRSCDCRLMHRVK